MYGVTESFEVKVVISIESAQLSFYPRITIIMCLQLTVWNHLLTNKNVTLSYDLGLHVIHGQRSGCQLKDDNAFFYI